jgi:hypothetical protein
VRSGFGLLPRQAGAIAHLGDEPVVPHAHPLLLHRFGPLIRRLPVGLRTGPRGATDGRDSHPRGQNCAAVQNAAIDDTGPPRTHLTVHHAVAPARAEDPLPSALE